MAHMSCDNYYEIFHLKFYFIVIYLEALGEAKGDLTGVDRAALFLRGSLPLRLPNPYP